MLISGGNILLYGLDSFSILMKSVLFFVVVQMLEFLSIVIECQTVTSSVWSGVSVALPFCMPLVAVSSQSIR